MVLAATDSLALQCLPSFWVSMFQYKCNDQILSKEKLVLNARILHFEWQILGLSNLSDSVDNLHSFVFEHAG